MGTPRQKLVADAIRDLALQGWKPGDTASVLGVHPRTVYRHLDRSELQGADNERRRRDLAKALESD